jgi:hypothetical protein
VNSHLRATVLALALGLSACQTGGEHPPQWKSAELAPPSESVLWAVAGQELQRMDFPVGSDADPSQMVMLTGWRTQLAPFRGKGYRQRAEVRFEKSAGGRYKVDVRVERETNMDVVDPLDLTRAKWEPAEDDVEVAHIVLQRIRARLGDSLDRAAAPGATASKKTAEGR